MERKAPVLVIVELWVYGGFIPFERDVYHDIVTAISSE